MARNYLRAMRAATAIFYHSNAKPPGAAGICRIVHEAEPDPTQFDPTATTTTRLEARRSTVGLGDGRAGPTAERFVPLDELRTIPEMAASQLLARGNRLSVLPLRDGEYDAILRAGGVRPPRRADTA